MQEKSFTRRVVGDVIFTAICVAVIEVFALYKSANAQFTWMINVVIPVVIITVISIIAEAAVTFDRKRLKAKLH